MFDSCPQDVLDFWFADGMENKWYFAGPEFDQVLRDKFLDLHTHAQHGGLAHWEATREGRLALLIVLDQFSRNIYRDQGKAFENDLQALDLAKRVLQMGDDIYFKKNHPASWRNFIYVVLMHSENEADQRRCLDLYLTHGPEFSIPFAREHLDVIQRFSRFPSRNRALGRESTPEEIIFLKLGGLKWAAVDDD